MILLVFLAAGYTGQHHKFLNEQKNCRELQGDKAGRFFYKQYDIQGKHIEFQKDINGNFLVADGVRQPKWPSFFGIQQSQDPCPQYWDGKLLKFEQDQSGFFWIMDYSDKIPLQYQKSQTFTQKLQGKYKVDPSSGLRMLDFIVDKKHKL